MSTASDFKKILVPADGSVSSHIALELAAFIAKKFKSRVSVVHVVTHEFMSPELQRVFVQRWSPTRPVPTVLPSSESASRGKVATEITRWYHQKGEEILTEALAFFNEEGVSADEKLIEHADPAETILEEAEKESYDLIVMGDSGEEEVEPHLGSVAKKVSRYAETPVLITRKKGSISKMLVPVDGSKNAQKTLRYAVAIAERADAEVTLLYVQESGLFKLRPKATKELGASILSGAADQIKGIDVDQRLESGDPAKRVAQIAEEEDYDLVVMGSRGLGAIGRFLLGSVSDHVLHYANRSVLVVR